MKGFMLELFTRHLIAETLLYDQELDVLGCLSLVDAERGRERYVAAFAPEHGAFVVEEATAWEDEVPEENAVGYALATETRERSRHDVPEEAAEVLVMLATQHSLLPSFTLLEGEESF
ncbi:MAG: hypothetical protein BRD45_06440 [Bacteroidetes bacterium QS_8_64_10]|jgi:hypothetical protein|nr:MAG: hypothetical protein BRD45_06440 [Bacteroidetes bacterium QS_8_64_10]